jgi:hypothetical protein
MVKDKAGEVFFVQSSFFYDAIFNVVGKHLTTTQFEHLKNQVEVPQSDQRPRNATRP